MNNTVEENTIDVWDHVLYKESANNPCESVIKIPNYPVMTNGKILDGYSYLKQKKDI